MAVAIGPGRPAQVHPYDGLTMIATMVNPLTGQLQDPAWVFPATTFKRIAYLSRGPRGPEYWVIASPTGHDRFARHRVPLQDLWRKLVPEPPDGQQPGPASESKRDQGTTYEQMCAAELIRQSRGRFALYRPAMDIAGRDLLVQLVDSWRTISLQIKGTTQIVRGTRIQCLVKRVDVQPVRKTSGLRSIFST